MSRTEEDAPIPPDDTEPLEEGNIREAREDIPVKADYTEVLPLDVMPSDWGSETVDLDPPPPRRKKYLPSDKGGKG